MAVPYGVDLLVQWNLRKLAKCRMKQNIVTKFYFLFGKAAGVISVVSVTYWKHSKVQVPSHAVSKCICIKLRLGIGSIQGRFIVGHPFPPPPLAGSHPSQQCLLKENTNG